MIQALIRLSMRTTAIPTDSSDRTFPTPSQVWQSSER